MEKSKLYTLSAIIFAVSTGIGFGGVKLYHTIRNDQKTDAIEAQTPKTATVSSPEQKPVTQNIPDAETQKPVNPDADEHVSNLMKEAQQTSSATNTQHPSSNSSSQGAPRSVASPKFSLGELTSIINDRGNNNYPRNISIRYTNLDTENGEEAQTSIANIRNYIRTGVWKSVTVVNATFDEKTGNPTSITLQINR